MQKPCFKSDIYRLKTPILNRADVVKKYLYKGYFDDKDRFSSFLRRLKRNQKSSLFKAPRKILESKAQEIKDAIYSSIFKNEKSIKDFSSKMDYRADISEVTKPIFDAIEKNSACTQGLLDEDFVYWVLRKVIKEKLILPDSSGECFMFVAISGLIGNPIIDTNYRDLQERLEKNGMKDSFNGKMKNLLDGLSSNKIRKTAHINKDLLNWIKNNKKDILTVILYEFVHVLENSMDYKKEREAYFTILLYSRVLRIIFDLSIEGGNCSNRISNLLSKIVPNWNIFYADKIDKQLEYEYIIEDAVMDRESTCTTRAVANSYYRTYFEKFDSEYRFDPVMKVMLTDDDIDQNIRKIKNNIDVLKNENKNLIMPNEVKKNDSSEFLFNADLVRIVEKYKAEIATTYSHHCIIWKLTNESTCYEELTLAIDAVKKVSNEYATDLLDRLKKDCSSYITSTKKQLIDKYEKQLKIYDNYKTYPKYLIDTLELSGYNLNYTMSFKREKGTFFMYDITYPYLKGVPYGFESNSPRRRLFSLCSCVDGVIFKKV